MIKIRDDIDLKELEKFGFEHIEGTKKYPEMYRFRRQEKYEDAFVLACNREVSGNCLYKIHELIQANLTEEVIELNMSEADKMFEELRI